MSTEALAPDAATIHQQSVQTRWGTVSRVCSEIRAMDARMQLLLPAEETLETDAAIDSVLRDALAVVEEARTVLRDLGAAI